MFFVFQSDGIEMSPIDGAYMSDTLIDEATRQQLLAAVKPLEDVPESDKDWHPDSGRLGCVTDWLM